MPLAETLRFSVYLPCATPAQWDAMRRMIRDVLLVRFPNGTLFATSDEPMNPFEVLADPKQVQSLRPVAYGIWYDDQKKPFHDSHLLFMAHVKCPSEKRLEQMFEEVDEMNRVGEWTRQMLEQVEAAAHAIYFERSCAWGDRQVCQRLLFVEAWKGFFVCQDLRLSLDAAIPPKPTQA